MSGLIAFAGIPLAFAWMGHLVYGNLFIALLEASAITVLFRPAFWKAFKALLAANVASSLAGFVLLALFQDPLEHYWDAELPLLALPRLLLLVGIVLFGITILIEWPFCIWLSELPRRPFRAFGMSLVAQAVSYPLLIAWYSFMSDASLLTETHFESELSFVKPPIATVYYIGADDGDIWRIQSDGGNKEKVLEAGITELNTGLSFVVEGDKVELWKIKGNWLATKYLEFPSTKRMIAADSEGQPPWRVHWLQELDFRSVDRRPFMVLARFDGLHVRSPDYVLDYTLEIRTPPVRWHPRDVTILPSNQVVFELGGQIFILDVYTRQLGFLTKGRAPAVLVDTADP